MIGPTQFLAWAHEQSANQQMEGCLLVNVPVVPPPPFSEQTLNKSQEVESSHIVSLFLKLKKIYSFSLSISNITKIAQFGKGMGNI
jgi:hypothetical protein